MCLTVNEKEYFCFECAFNVFKTTNGNMMKIINENMMKIILQLNAADGLENLK